MDKIEDYATYRIGFFQKFGSSVKHMNFEEFSDLWDREFDGEDSYACHTKTESAQWRFV